MLSRLSRQLLLLAALAACASAFMEENEDDMDYLEDPSVTNFFDEVVVPMREAAREALRPQAVVGPANATSLQCSADQLTVRILEADRKLVIVGGGPAGMAAATYAARAELQPLVVARDGGQLESTDWVDNYPGFPEGIDAVEMVQRFEKQATRFGAEVKWCGIERVDLKCRPFKVYCEDGEVMTSSAIIIATGASPRWLGAPGERELLSKGVHTCATCDGYQYKDRHTLVVGGGDTAMEQALFLARVCSRVTVVHRGGTLRASKAMAARVLRHPKILMLWNSVVTEFVKGDNGVLESVSVESLGSTTIVPVDGAFVAIGHTPNTELFSDLRRDDHGYVYTLPGSTVMSIAGVYAAGDVADPVYRQAITSAGTGAIAAMDAERWLCEHGC